MTTVEPSYKLYPLWAIAALTAGGGVFVGALMLALNYRRLGKPDYAWQVVILGVAVGLLEISAFIFAGLPKSEILGWCVSITQGVALYFIARKLQGEAIEQHVSSGGEVVRSYLHLIGIGLFGTFVFWMMTFLAVAVGVILNPELLKTLPRP